MFNPKFNKVSSIHAVADMINVPHEDYPRRVGATEDMIAAYRGASQITRFDIMSIHSFVMWDMDSRFRGTTRTMNVRVGRSIPPDALLVNGLLDQILPVFSGGDLVEWYRVFQEIHPFADGNGRVGGIVVASLSNSVDAASFLAPLQ